MPHEIAATFFLADAQYAASCDPLAAAVAALRQAIECDLPDRVVPQLGAPADDGLPQHLRRDVYAAARLYGIRVGPVRIVTRRPTIWETRTLLIPRGDGYAIVVWAASGAAVVYEPRGRDAVRIADLPAVTQDALDALAA